MGACPGGVWVGTDDWLSDEPCRCIGGIQPYGGVEVYCIPPGGGAIDGYPSVGPLAGLLGSEPGN